MQNRTVQEFVEDLVSDGKSLNEILIVTVNSRWASQKGEVKKEHQSLKKRSVANIS